MEAAVGILIFMVGPVVLGIIFMAATMNRGLQPPLNEQQRREREKAAQIGAASATLYHMNKDKIANNKLFDSEVGKFIKGE